ncbi:MAG: GldG family protein [Parvularculaceae bacterium]
MSAQHRHGIDAKRGAAIAIGLLIVLFFSLNILVDRFGRSARIDFTENGIYTISSGTRELLRSIEEPITLNFYYSRDAARNFAQVRAHAARIRDMLITFSAIAGDKLVVNFIEPQPFSREEDEANAAGIRAVATGPDQTLYFGLAGENSVDGREVIEFFAPEREAFLEYDIVRLIDRLNTPEPPKVGLLTTLPLQFGPGGPQAMMQGQSRPAQIYTMLENGYDLVTLTPDLTMEELAELSALIIAQPPQLEDEALYALDQFLLNGGRAMVFLDPSSDLGRANPAAQGDPSALDALLEAWGVEFDAESIVLDRARGLRFPDQRNGRTIEISHPLLPRFEVQDLKADDPATSDLQRGLQMGSIGSFSVREDASVTFEPIVTTSEDTMTIEASRALFAPDPNELLREFLATGERRAVAARVTGDAPSAFPDGPPEGVAADDHLAQARSPLNVILIADADMLDDRYYVFDRGLFMEVTADNAFFVLNALDNILGSDALLSLRARAPSNRPMTAIDNLRREAEARFLQEEERLQAELEATEARLEALQREGSGDGQFLTAPSPEEQAEIARFQAEMLRIRQDLRDVQRNLNADIEALKGLMIFLNVWAAPLALSLGAGFVAWRRRRAPKAPSGAPIAGM